MPNKQLILRKISKILEYLNELQEFKGDSKQKFLSSFLRYHTVERLIQLIVDTAIDINQHIIVDSGNPPPKDYYNSFISLYKMKVFSKNFAEKIASSAGLRNRIIHEYGSEEFSYDILYKSMKETLKTYPEYLEKIKKFIT